MKGDVIPPGQTGASVVVCTRDRKDLLAVSIESCLAQAYRPLEVIVMDDASEDGTHDLVREHFPEVRLVRIEGRPGLAALRNRSLEIATGESVFFIDDDAYFTDRGTVEHVVRVLERDEQVGAIAMTFAEPHSALGRRGRAAEPLEDGMPLRSFRGCAHALRRRAAESVGGYRELLVYQGEERDLALRLLEAGFRIVYAEGAPIVHLVSPVRDRAAMDAHGVRNTLLFDWLNIPQPYVLPRLAADVIQLFLYKLRISGALARAGHITRGLKACIEHRGLRRPVSRAAYRLYRSLPGHGPEPAPAILPKPLARRMA